MKSLEIYDNTLESILGDCDQFEVDFSGPVLDNQTDVELKELCLRALNMQSELPEAMRPNSRLQCYKV
jgi:hypothetical protein